MKEINLNMNNKLDWHALRHALEGDRAAATLKGWQEHPLFQWGRALSATVPTAVLVYDTSTSVVHYASPETLAVLGYPPEFYVRGGVQTAISTAPPAHQPALIGLYLRAVEHTRRLTAEQRMALRLTTIRPYLRPDGAELWAYLMTLPLDLTPAGDNVRTLITFISPQAKPTGGQPSGTLTYVVNPSAPPELHELHAINLLEPTVTDGQGLRLSPRELEVLALAARGLSSKQIAAQLGISLVTVNTHRHRLLTKSGAQNITELVTRALAEGLL